VLGYHRQARILGVTQRHVNEIVACDSESVHSNYLPARSAVLLSLAGQHTVLQAVSLIP